MNIIYKYIIRRKVSIFVLALVTNVVVRTVVDAVDLGCSEDEDSDCGLSPKSSLYGRTFRGELSWALWFLAAISVIMIIIGGFRYATSQGDQTQMQSAKNTILYAVIGLIVAIAAYAIVSFVVTQFIEAPATPVAT